MIVLWSWHFHRIIKFDHTKKLHSNGLHNANYRRMSCKFSLVLWNFKCLTTASHNGAHDWNISFAIFLIRSHGKSAPMWLNVWLWLNRVQATTFLCQMSVYAQHISIWKYIYKAYATCEGSYCHEWKQIFIPWHSIAVEKNSDTTWRDLCESTNSRKSLEIWCVEN